MATGTPNAGDRTSWARSSSPPNPNHGELLNLMVASALFQGLTRLECMQIAASGRPRVVARDEFLYRQGQPARNLIFLQSGSVKHTQISSSGNEVLLWMSGAGDTVNVMAIAESFPCTCSAQATEQCEVLAWDHTRFSAFLDRNPRLRQNISLILSGRVVELEQRFREVATEKAEKRLALILLRLSRQIGKVSHEGTAVFLTREELGQMTGSTLFTISRIISQWAEEGIVVARRESVLINNRELLETIGDQFE
jgi:CRP/FNR family transcriptional regulator, nitrogen oxide reductase regulator